MFESSDGLNLRPENYRLVVGERIGYNFTGQSCRIPTNDSNEYPNLNAQSRAVPLELWEYLESLRDPEHKPRPTFYFPDQKAGPDLVFALEPVEPEIDSISKRILCVVQVKTGSMGDIPYAIMTTDLSQAFLDKSADKPGVVARLTQPQSRRCSDSWNWSSDSPINPPGGFVHPSDSLRNSHDSWKKYSDSFAKNYEKLNATSRRTNPNHEAMEQELQHWADRTVIRILIATQYDSVDPEDINLVKQQRYGNNYLNDYFILFGKSSTEHVDQDENQNDEAYVGDLFGDRFMNILEQVKFKSANTARMTAEEIETQKTSQKAKDLRKKRAEKKSEEQEYDNINWLFD